MTASAGVPSGRSVAYTYDLADRLTAIATASGSTTSFTIDALGRHASQTVGTSPTQTYSYLGSSQTVVAISSGSTTTTSAIDAVGDRVATASGGSFGYLLADLHGNMAAAFNAAGTSFSDAFAYDAWGEVVSSVTSSLPTPWRYQGRILESAAGTPDLYDFGARSYAPGIGTFTSLDSVHGSAQNPRLLNGYLYADANPATLVDPDGHCPRGYSQAYYGSSMSCQPTAGQQSIDDEEGYYQAASRHAPAEAQYAASIKAQDGLNDEQSYYQAEARYAQSGSGTQAEYEQSAPGTQSTFDPCSVTYEGFYKTECNPVYKPTPGTRCPYGPTDCDAGMARGTLQVGETSPAADTGCSLNPFDGNSCLGQAAGVVAPAYVNATKCVVAFECSEVVDYGFHHPAQVAAGLVIVGACATGVLCGAVVAGAMGGLGGYLASQVEAQIKYGKADLNADDAATQILIGEATGGVFGAWWGVPSSVTGGLGWEAWEVAAAKSGTVPAAGGSAAFVNLLLSHATGQPSPVDDACTAVSSFAGFDDFLGMSAAAICGYISGSH